MNKEETISSISLKNTSNIMQYEAMVSRPGISQPHSNFIWASTFKAPIGISVKDDQAFFDIFLPEGSENEGDKKLFLNRVGAKLQDGIWHARRTNEQLKDVYGPNLNFPLLSYNTLFNDYSYIENGRVYIHFLFNVKDLSVVSNLFLSLDTEALGLKLEFLRKLNEGTTAFHDLRNWKDSVSVTIEASKDGEFENTGPEKANFLMSKTLNVGVKSLAYAKEGKLPGILEPHEPEQLEGNIFTFYCSNKLIVRLMDLMFEESAIFYGYHGYATENKLSLTINLPKPLIALLLRVIGKVEKDVAGYTIRLREVVDFS